MKSGAYKKALIGKQITVVKSNDSALVGMQGKIIDETKNMITVVCKDKEKKLIKNSIKVKIDGKVVNGKQLIGTVANRIKR